MRDVPSLARTTLGFTAGAAGLASAFVLILARAVMRSDAPHGAPTPLEYRFGAAALLLLIAAFAATITLRRAALPVPSARAGFIAGMAGVTLLLCTMMLAGKPLGMLGVLVVAVLAGIASAAGASGTSRPRRVRTAAI